MLHLPIGCIGGLDGGVYRDCPGVLVIASILYAHFVSSPVIFPSLSLITRALDGFSTFTVEGLTSLVTSIGVGSTSLVTFTTGAGCSGSVTVTVGGSCAACELLTVIGDMVILTVGMTGSALTSTTSAALFKASTSALISSVSYTGAGVTVSDTFGISNAALISSSVCALSSLAFIASACSWGMS